ncbi:MAG: hypothetical protein FWE85_06310 [Clostridiales bacterium]|nr:hypothetical protein [Clostridiales bacterium]
MLKKLMPVLLKHSAKAACKDIYKKIGPDAAWGAVGFGLGLGLGLLASCCVPEYQHKRKKPGLLSFWLR